MSHQQQVLKEALRYIALGWKVFPLHSIDANGCCTCGSKTCTDAGKHPRVRRGLKDASADEQIVNDWFGKGAPLSNIGLATGEISGITVLDIDIGEGKGGAETWADLTKEKGEPETLMARTGSGGLHVIFKYNSVLKTSSNTLGKGVDCRNDGGYIVAPPSKHRSGGVYTWHNELSPASLPVHLSKRKENRGRPRKDDPTRQKYSIEQVRSMLEKVDAGDRDLWRHVGIILGREYNRVDEAWELYNWWSDRWGGKKGRGHAEIMKECFYDLSQQPVEKELSMGSIVRAAIEGGWTPKQGEVPPTNFIFYGPGNNFIYRPTSSFWIGEAVNAAVSPINEAGKLVKPAEWLKQHALSTSMTKDPSLEGDYVKGYDCRDGVLIKQEGAAVFNSYRPPTIELGDAKLAKPFVEHVERVFPKPGDAKQFLDYMAHRVQRPDEKPRFALLIAGAQGVGKDTAIEFCIPAIGAWNCANIEPGDLDTGFNEFAANVLVRVSEAANLHDMSKWAFNERMKVLIAGVPDNIAINPKYGQKYSVRLHCGVIITTNHMATGIYIPADDRRYDVIDAASKLEMGIETDKKSKDYFSDLWGWFLEDGGASHVAAFLHERDIKKFSAANGQRKTEAHKTVVTSNMTSDHWLLDVLEELKDPKVVRADAVMGLALKNGGNAKEYAVKLQPGLIRCGYFAYRNPNRSDGRWKFDDKLTMVYAKQGADLKEVEEIRKNLKVAF
jgi:hypothetical protein